MKKIDIALIKNNIFDEFNKGWALLTAGNKESHNTMTISWGQCGFLWRKNIISVYVRPQRYTKEFMDNQDYFTVSFFQENYKKELGYLGTTSGRNIDKISNAHFNVIELEGSVGINEANYIFVCKKIYVDKIKKENFIDNTIIKEYPLDDFHQVYIGEIVAVYSK